MRVARCFDVSRSLLVTNTDVSQVRAEEQPFLQTGESHRKLSIISVEFQNSYACHACHALF